MNKRPILTRAYDSYKNVGLKLSVFRIFQKALFACLILLNKRRLFSVTKNGKRIIKEINGSKMYLDVEVDDGLCRFLAIANIREGYITETMKNELQNCTIVVDIGANIGYYALLEARMLGDKGRVYALEPVPHTIELLRANVELNNYSNIL